MESLGTTATASALATELANLATHLQDPERVAEDAHAAGGSVRRTTLVFWVFTVATGAFFFVSIQQGWLARHPVYVLVELLLVVIAMRATIADRRVVARRDARSPATAAESAFRALGQMRDGYFWSALSPDGRRAPAHASVRSLGIELRRPEDVALFTRALFHVWGGPRSINVVEASVIRSEDDVAEVALDMEIRTMPIGTVLVGIAAATWCYTQVGALASLVVYAGALVLALARRRKDRFTMRKTVLRGPNGLWYVRDPNLRNDVTYGR